jgi:5-methylcytosine rRNA methyltransferase NSUN4
MRWKSMRLALLCEHKYVAMVNNFGDDEKTSAMLENDGAVNIREVYDATKRLMKEQNTGTLTTERNIQSRIDQFIEEKEGGELFSSRNKSQESETAQSEPVNYKKPLEKVIEEDSDIDYGRLVDPSHGTSALHEFVPATKIKGMEDFVLESDHYRYYSNTTDFPLKIEIDLSFKIPENLQLYTYEQGNISTLRTPRQTSTGVSSHFLLDGGSILPPLALNIQPGDHVFDACAAPGGKSLLMLQTHLPKVLVANDCQLSRCNRIRKVMDQFIYDFDTKWNNHRCIIRHEDARNTSEYGVYDKVLVDVPCTTDRLSVNTDENNIFKQSRIKERLRIPELQSAILENCIRLLKPGGSLVYSTCSLSPIQNDGVVHMALSNVFKDNGITMTINDLSLMMQPFNSLMKFEHPKGLKYGQMVIPFLPANFGPMYFCKMTRN